MPLDLRRALRIRAGEKCEYCQLRERHAALRFQQDHVIARKHRGANALENLAWACADCNAYKGTDLTGIDPLTGRVERLFNPRTQHWNEHFEWKGPVLVPKTPEGRVTVVLLQIIRDDRLALRRELMDAALW